MGTKTIIKHYCDVCGEECEPVSEVTIFIRFESVEFNSYLVFKPYIYKPYITDKGIICKSCLIKHLKKYVEEEERNLLLRERKT